MRPVHRPGATLVELAMFIVVAAIVAGAFGSLSYSAWASLTFSQERLNVQQAFERARSLLEHDVHGSSGLQVADATTCMTRRYDPGVGFRYVTWRFDAARLQRGESNAAETSPTAWEDVVDPLLVQAAAGGFAYFDRDGAATTAAAAARRVELAGLGLRVVRTGEVVPAPPITASMREGGNARLIVLVGAPDYAGDAANWKGTVHVQLDLLSRNGQPIVIRAFAADWREVGGNEATLRSIKRGNGNTIWNAGPDPYEDGGAPRVLDRTLRITPGMPEDLSFHFMVRNPISRIDLRLYDDADLGLDNPYVIPIPLS